MLINRKKKRISTISFSEAAEKWLLSNSLRIKGSTEIKYGILLKKHILPYFSDIQLSDITSNMISEFLYKKQNEGHLKNGGKLSASYICTIRVIIISVLRFAAQEGYCLPLTSPVYKPQRVKKDIIVLDEKLCRALENDLSKQADNTSAGILIALHTGMRIGEICALRWSDIDLIQKTITVRHTVCRINSNVEQTKSTLILGSPKTRSSARVIPINSFLLPILIKLKNTSVSEYVISDKATFVSPRTFEYRFHKKTEHLQIGRMNFHTLRHTFATRCIARGVDEKSLSEILGHSDVGITLNIYVHSSMDMKRTALEKLVQNF